MRVRRVLSFLLAALGIAALTTGRVGAAPDADPALAQAMQRGGLVLVLRHAATDFTKPDQDPVDLDDCRTQRNLSAQGRADARSIGSGARRLKLQVVAVLSSAFCRTKDTARLAFGRFAVSPALLNTIVAEHDSRWRRQIRAARHLLGTRPAQGMLTVLVTHGVVVDEVTGHTLEEGETLVFRPLGSSRFRLLGRILPREWRTLRPA